MTTRSLILSRAFGRIAIGSYEFDLTPDEKEMARRELSAMLREWEMEGITLGYVEPDDDDNDAGEMTTPVWADAMIWNNLAIRLAPEFGKAPSPQLNRDARRGYNLAVTNTLIIPVESRPRLGIRGGGDRSRWITIGVNAGAGGEPVAPPGYVLLTDENGVYLTQPDGTYLAQPI